MAGDPLQLPPLPSTEPSWGAFQVWWQQVKEAIEASDAAQQYILDAIEEAVTGSNGLATRTAILGSYSIPTMIITATDVGANVTITIAAHNRQYGDGTDLSVAGGSLTGKSYSTTYAIYYDDETMLDTTPTYVATTNLEEAQHNYGPGRHYVGTVTTPAAAGGPTTGGSPPAGSGYTAGASAQVIT
jgi:hypothetical protein